MEPTTHAPCAWMEYQLRPRTSRFFVYCFSVVILAAGVAAIATRLPAGLLCDVITRKRRVVMFAHLEPIGGP